MNTTRVIRVAVAALLLACLAACKNQEMQLKILTPPIDGGGACNAYTDLACVNYLEFRVLSNPPAFCVALDVSLNDLCDVEKLANGSDVFKLPPETRLPIAVLGKRVFPAGSCGSNKCDKLLFRGETGPGFVRDYIGRTLELTIDMAGSCGKSENFFFLPDGGTCVDVCGGESKIVCANVGGGCLCEADVDGGQGGIDASQ